MKVVLAFPWRPTEDRLEAWQITKELLPTMYDFAFVVTADSGHHSFNRPASRNLCVNVAKKNKADVIVLCDADSVPQPDPLVAAIEAAADGLMHFPFHEAWYISYKGMLRVRQQASPEQVRSRIWDKCFSEGGIWVCKPQTYYQAGEQDHRLNGWGCDDRAFLAASRTLVGMPVKHEGFLYCLPHTRPSEEEIWVPKEVELMIEYQDAYEQPERMKGVVAARPPMEFPDPKIDILKGRVDVI